RVWSERMHGSKDKEAWERIFTPGGRLWRGLISICEYIEYYGTGGGLSRPMFAEFFAEAAEATKDKRLAGLGKTYGTLGRQWSDLATAAVPEEIPLFRQVHTALIQRHELMADGAPVEDIRAAWRLLEGLTAQARERFPLSPEQSEQLRASLQQAIQKL